MNKVCKVVWSQALQQMVVVSELVSSRGKAKSTTLDQSPVELSAWASECFAVWTVPVLLSAMALGLGGVFVPATAQTVANTALPTGGHVASGQASISSRGANMVIDQATQRAAINWQSFNVGKDAHVHFNNAGGSTLNRATGPEASTILGRITAPGQVIISNGNGVFFGRGSMVDVGSLIATTHSISNERFMAGALSFERNGATGSVVNEGELRAKLEGYIALIAPEVRNQGLIVASKGTVALGAGELVELQLDPSNKLTNIRVQPGQWQALVDNKQAIEAEGGLVILSAMAARELQGGVVNNSGSINASSISSVGGRVILTGDHITLGSSSSITATGATGGGQVLVGGDWQGGANAERRVLSDPNALHQATTVTMEQGASIDVSATVKGDGGVVVLWSDIQKLDSVTQASGTVHAKGGSQGGDGGAVETSGNTIQIDHFQVDTRAASDALGATGHWLIDPYDYTIGATQATAIGSAMNTSNVTVSTSANTTSYGSNGNISSTGNITINAAITGANSLTLNAAGDVNLNASLTTTSATSGNIVIHTTGLNGTGNITLASGRSLTVNQSGDSIYQGIISGTGATLTKSGAGVLSLLRANTYGGGTTVSEGKLGVYSNTALGTGAVTMGSNTGLVLGRGVTEILNDFSLTGQTTLELDTNVDYLIVGGGGGGGSRISGGGGGGGVKVGSIDASGSIEVVVGVGGAANQGEIDGGGGDSRVKFSSTIEAVGGLGAINNGGRGATSGTGLKGGSLYVVNNNDYFAGGGGGAGTVGGNGRWARGGTGGTGIESSITGSAVFYGGGGGGGATAWTGGGGPGGTGGGGAGGGGNARAQAGTNGLGGGGGGGGVGFNDPPQSLSGAAGGSGVVMVRYMGSTAGSGGSISAGTGSAAGYTLHTFTSIGASTLTLNAINLALKGVISGTGSLSVNATNGTVTLAGINTYSGNTSITGGTVIVGGSGTLGGGNYAGNISNAGTLRYSSSVDQILGGIISGAGSLFKDTSSTSKLILNGDNNRSGPTTISAGTLQVGDGGTTGSLGSGSVTNNGALVFNRSNSLTHSGLISGTGSLTQQGSGTLTLTQNNNYTGANTIANGVLVLANDAPNPTIKTFNGSGQLRIEPAGISFSGGFLTSSWTFGTSLSGLTLGKDGNTAAVTIDSALSIAGPIALYGGNVAIDGPLVSTGTGTQALIALKGTGNVTDGPSGYVQSGVDGAGNLLLLGGNVTLDNSANNDVGTLAASGVSGLTYLDKAGLVIGTVGTTPGVSATGVVNVGTQLGSLSITQNVVTTNASSAALTLNASIGSAINTDLNTEYNLLVSGVPTISVGAGGVARLYTGGISDSSALAGLSGLGAGSGRFRYNADETTDFSSPGRTPLSVGLNVIYREQPSATVTVANKSTTYGDVLPTLTGTVSGSVNGDSPSYVVSNRLNSSSGNIRADSYTLTETGLAALGYNVTVTVGTLKVDTKNLTLTGLLAADKTYNRDATATISSYGSLSGLMGSDAVSFEISGVTADKRTFDDWNAGANKTVTISGLRLNGGDADNYTIGNQTTTATIHKAALTLAAVTDTKVYNATTISSGTVSVTGLVTGDSFNTLSQSFDSKDVMGAGGSTLRVNTGWAIDGGSSNNNYTVTTTTATGTINPKALTISGLTSANKVYDGTFTAAVSGSAVMQGGLDAGAGTSTDGKPYSSDTVSLTGTVYGQFNSKDVASASTVSFSGLNLTGADAGNYSLTPHATASHTISPATLTVRANDNAKFVTTADPSLTVSYSGFVNGETTSVLTTTPIAVRAGVGTAEATGIYDGALTVSGGSAANYTIDPVAGKFTILGADQLLVRVQRTSAEYGSTAPYTLSSVKYVGQTGQASLNVSSVGENGAITGLSITSGATKFVIGDELNVSSGAGTGARVKVTSVTSGGVVSGVSIVNAGENYAAGTTLTAQYTREVSVAAIIDQPTSGVSLNDGAGTTATFTLSPVSTTSDNSTAGQLKVGAYQLGGQTLAISGGNFNAMTVVGDLTVNQKALTPVVNDEAKSKTYDGTAAMLGLDLNSNSTGKVGADQVSLSGSGSFSDKNVSRDSGALAANKSYTVSGITLSGADAGNYYVANGTLTASNGQITPKTLSVTYTGVDKIYDRLTTASVTTGDNRITGDNLTIARTANFVNATNVADKHVAYSGTTVVTKNISITGASLSGDDAGNYALASTTGTASATITPAPLVISGITGVDKTYNRTNEAFLDVDISKVKKTGLLAGDVVDLNATGVYSGTGADGYNAGLGKSITITSSYSGADVGNYVITSQASTVASISKRPVSVSAAGGVSKAYDGTTAMVGVSITVAPVAGVPESGVVSGDVVTVSGLGQFDTPGVNRDTTTGAVLSTKTYALSDLELGGVSVQNYTIVGGATSLSGSNGRIDPKVIQVAGIQAADKFYDGSVGAVLSGGNLIGVVGADDVTFTDQTGVFANKNVGSQTVSISGITLHGAAKGNYALDTTTASATARIHRQESVTWVGGTAGDWFTASNWALTNDLTKTGAVPDLSNVATVVVPTATTVSFNNTSGAVNIDQLNGVGSTLSLSTGALNVGLQGATLAGFNQSGGAFTSTGPVTVGSSFAQTGGSFTTSGAAGDVSLTQTGGTLTWADIDIAGNLTVSGVKVNFGKTRVGGNLLSTTTGAGALGGVTQVSGMIVEGSASFVADTGADQDAVLTNASNDFKGTVNFTRANSGSWKNMSLKDKDGIKLGDIDIGGNLNVDAGDDITQDKTAPNKIVVGKDTYLTADGDITLDGPNNDFKGTVNADGKNITLRDENGITLGDISSNEDFKVTAGGDITQDTTNGKKIVVGGDTYLTAAGDITLDGPDNDFKGTVNADGKNITLKDTNGITLGDIISDEDFKVTAGGDITQDTTDGKKIVVGGDTYLTADGDITLDGPNNDFKGSVNADGKTITLNDENGIKLGEINSDEDFKVTAGGDITQDSTNGKKIVIGGDTYLTADGDITLDGPDNDFKGTVNADGKNINLRDANDLKTGDLFAEKKLNLRSDGDIELGKTIVGEDFKAETGGGDLTQTDKLVVVGKTDIDAGSGKVTLTHPDNNMAGGVSTKAQSSSVVGDKQGDAAAAEAAAQAVAEKAAADKAAADKAAADKAAADKAAADKAAADKAAADKAAADKAAADKAAADKAAADKAAADKASADKAAADEKTGPALVSAITSMSVSDRLPVVTANLVSPTLGDASNVSSSAADSPAASGAGASGIEVQLVNRPEINAQGVVAVTLPQGTSTGGAGFVFALPTELVQQIPADVRVSLVDGSFLPSWLSFNPATGEFTATAVPDRAFPIRISLTWGSQQLLVVISEKQS